MTEKVKHKAYPTHEAAGFVWVYMGPPDEQPESLGDEQGAPPADEEGGRG